jgi:hypothetical protein
MDDVVPLLELREMVLARAERALERRVAVVTGAGFREAFPR